MDILFYVLAGAGVGLAIGLTGVGGGSLMTPLLILFGFPYHIAIGTDLLYAAATKAGGMASHRRQGNINWQLTLRLALGSVPATLLTLLLLKTVFGDANAYKPLLTTSLGIMLILTSAVLILKPHLQRHTSEAPENARSRKSPVVLTVLMGVFLGVFVTLSSVGAGAIGTAILMLLYPALQARQVVGTDIAHAVPLTLIAGLGHMAVLGNVDFLLLACLLVGSLPAVNLGARLSSNLPHRFLQPILATILMALGVKFAIF